MANVNVLLVRYKWMESVNMSIFQVAKSKIKIIVQNVRNLNKYLDYKVVVFVNKEATK